MTAFRVLLDGETIATVNTSGYDVVSVRVSGRRTDTEFATLEMSGGSYPEIGESTHLIWINSQELLPGQRIEVRLLESGLTFPSGKTIEELFPEERGASENIDFKPTKEMFEKLRAMPSLRSGFSLNLLGSSGVSFIGRTASEDYAFGFNVVWNSHRPGRASHSLYAYTLDELENRLPMRDFVREYIEAPYTISLQINA